MSSIAQIKDKIKFSQIDIELFDETARKTADIIAENSRNNNKPTQLRRFYDEIVMWYDKLQGKDNADYLKALPFIKMINAKVAYAKGRKHVDEQYVQLMSHCMRQLDKDNIDTFFHFKLFMEAFMGFYKSSYETHTQRR